MRKRKLRSPGTQAGSGDESRYGLVHCRNCIRHSPIDNSSSNCLEIDDHMRKCPKCGFDEGKTFSVDAMPLGNVANNIPLLKLAFPKNWDLIRRAGKEYDNKKRAEDAFEYIMKTLGIE